MRESKKKLTAVLEDPQRALDAFYDPLGDDFYDHLKKDSIRKSSEKYCSPFFSTSQVEPHVMKQVTLNQPQDDQKKKPKDPVLSKIFGNTKNTKKNIKSKNNQQNEEAFYCFNSKIKIAYPQTPGFKNLLQSPFGKFNSIHKEIIDCLSKDKDTRLTFETVDIEANPFNFFNQNTKSFCPGKYFIGIAMFLKEKQCIPQSLFFCNLACYAEPYNEKVWKKFISMEQQYGNIKKAHTLSKTAFLFTQTQDVAKSYLTNGEKCGTPMNTLQGLLSSVSNPQALEKTVLPQSAKLQIKYGNAWKGLKILHQICRNYDYKLAVCSIILFTAKYLQNTGYTDEAIKLLYKSFNKSMTKLQIYTMYLQMAIRQQETIDEQDLQEVLRHVDFISGQNRYRLYLEMAEILYRNNDARFYEFIHCAYQSALQYCAPGAGTNKAFKQIYFSILKLRRIPPNVQSTNDHVIFQKNRYNFINGIPLIEHQFSDWKYYLHYGVVKNYEFINLASKKWPLTGRLIAEWIHCLRATRTPLQMLKLWRQKIDEVPKSGELWCEGGRIYAELGQFKNASKCFRYAIHFTPQYGDSFLEELRLLLKESRYHEIEKLKKLFLVSEPFYGHVLSYVKLNHYRIGKLSMNEVWQNATEQINLDLYRPQQERIKMLTSYPPYNNAYLNPTTMEQKQNLFASYEQMDNKN